MSERHLLRRFTAELGVTPARYVAASRFEAARRELEDSDDTVAAIAATRRLRHRRVDAPHVRPPPRRAPDDYRRRFTPPTEGIMTTIAIPLFPRFTALDGIGPYEVLQRIPGFDITFVGHERGVVRSDNGFLGIEVDATYDELPAPDVVVFPGGVGTRAAGRRRRVLDWVRRAHETTTFTTSVCTGSLVLAAAGLLDGLTATTHWTVMDTWRSTARCPTSRAGGRAPRPADHHRRRCVERHRHGPAPRRAARRPHRRRGPQLMIEYDPQPPFDAGAVDKAGADVIARVIEYAAVQVLNIRVFGATGVLSVRTPRTRHSDGRQHSDGTDQTAVAQNVSPRALLASVATSTSSPARRAR